MADDAHPFIPPLGDFTPPVIQSDVATLVEQVIELLQATASDEVLIDGGTGRRVGAPWFPVVMVKTGETEAFMSPGTARRIADMVAVVTTLFDRGRLAARFTNAAEEAERLAADSNRKEQH